MLFISYSRDQIINLFLTTFQGSSTQQIQQASRILSSYSQKHFNPFLNSCEQILQSKHENNNLCRSVCNFIKYLTKNVIQKRLINENGPKDYINKIQRLLDNSKIPNRYKQPISFSYIKAAIHYGYNFEKISEKICYLYKIKEANLGVLLARAYISAEQETEYKAQSHYYKRILPLQIKQLSEAIKQYQIKISQGSVPQQSHIIMIHELLKNLHASLGFISFQKFQSSIFSCLQKPQMIQIVNGLQILKEHSQIVILLRQVIRKILQNIFRMKKIQKLQISLLQKLGQQIHKQWQSYQGILIDKRSLIYHPDADFKHFQQEVSLIKLLTTAFTSNFIYIVNDGIDIFTLFIEPLFMIRLNLFTKNVNTDRQIQDTFSAFEDICFFMKSQTIDTELNKMVKNILNNYLMVSSKIYNLLNVVLFQNKFSVEQLASKLQSQSGRSQILVLLNFLCFQVSYFMTNESMIKKIQRFLANYQPILFRKQNPEVYFHALLLLDAYQDDIFSQQEQYGNIFKSITYNFLFERKSVFVNKNNRGGYDDSEDNNIICFLEQRILKKFYESGFSDRMVKDQRQMIINHLMQKFDRHAVSIFIKIMKNYTLQDKVALQIFDQMLRYVDHLRQNSQQSNIGKNRDVYVFIKFLQTFFSIQSYKHLFQSTLSRILPVFQILISDIDQYIDHFFSIINNVITHLQYVPSDYLAWMRNIFRNQTLQSQYSYKTLVTVLKYINQSKNHKYQSNKNTLQYETFVNCMVIVLVDVLNKCSNQNRDNKVRQMQNKGFSNDSQSGADPKQYFCQYKKLSTPILMIKKQILTLMTLHQCIYYHSAFLTSRVLTYLIRFTASCLLQNRLNQNHPNEQQYPFLRRSQFQQFSFVKGKYQLIFVLLFRYRLKQTNQILLSLNKHSQNNNQKTIQKRVYDAVYMTQNTYLIQYDTPLYIKLQLYILSNLISYDNLQKTYANTSFLSLFHKYSQIYQIKHKVQSSIPSSQYPDLQSSDSDEQQIQPQHYFKSKWKQLTKLIVNFNVPNQWSKINQTQLLKQFLVQKIMKNDKSREWLRLLQENCLQDNQKKLLESVMKDLECVNGKFRTIRKINNNNWN